MLAPQAMRVFEGASFSITSLPLGRHIETLVGHQPERASVTVPRPPQLARATADGHALSSPHNGVAVRDLP